MYGLEYRRVESGDAFDAALISALAHEGADLIEVQVDRESSVARHRHYWAAAAG
jgi:2-succinyl-5-enolpyruvyl-6-hydroxy-3-cyclohexene-1-carboxylate synthase